MNPTWQGMAGAALFGVVKTVAVWCSQAVVVVVGVVLWSCGCGVV